MKHEQGKAEHGNKDQKAEKDLRVWSIEGVVLHPIYSPKGGIEGMMLDADGVPVQFVFGHGPDGAAAFGKVEPGQRVTLEGTEARPWPEGENAHAVYQFKRLASIDGKAADEGGQPAHAKGKVVRMNYARDGEANGVLLDSGDFVHVRPDRFATLGIAPGDQVEASGPSRPLADGSGRVIDAVTLNGKPLDNKLD
jgi:hypothetical protein